MKATDAAAVSSAAGGAGALAVVLFPLYAGFSLQLFGMLMAIFGLGGAWNAWKRGKVEAGNWKQGEDVPLVFEDDEL